MKKTLNILVVIFAVIFSVFFFFYLFLGVNYPVLYRNEFEKASAESKIDLQTLFAIAKTESGFRVTKTSNAGAVGMMQLMPSTAKFVCSLHGEEFEEDKLTDASYNIRLGALYLAYLFNRFEVKETAFAAYNAGEGNVKSWLNDEKMSDDGKTLKKIPFKETRDYVQKIIRAEKVYKFLLR